MWTCVKFSGLRMKLHPNFEHYVFILQNSVLQVDMKEANPLLRFKRRQYFKNDGKEIEGFRNNFYISRHTTSDKVEELQQTWKSINIPICK